MKEAKNNSDILKLVPFAYAHHKIILDENNNPVDYVYLDTNKAFEEMTGLKAENIINKKVTEILPEIKKGELDWINFFGNVSINQTEETFEQYSLPLNRWYKGHAFSTEKGYFTVTFTDITNEYKMADYAKELNEYNYENIDYNQIADNASEISGADYTILNIFDKNGEDFYTKAVSGISKIHEKITNILGFNLENKKWKNPVREEKIKDKKTIIFEDLNELTTPVISKNIIKIINKTFNLGQIVLVKTTKDNKMVGDLTLIYKKNNKLKNKSLIETYADLVGMTINRINAEYERKKQELKLKEQMIKFNQSKKLAKFGYWERDLELGEEYWDDNYFKIFEYEPQEFKPCYENFLKLVHNNHLEMVKENSKLINNIHKTMNKTEIEKLEKEIPFKAITKNNNIIHLNSFFDFIYNEKGFPIKLFGFMQDITSIKISEEIIKSQSEKLNTLLNTIPDLLFIYDNNGNYREVYTKDDSLLAFPKEKLLKSNLKDIINKEDCEKHFKAYKKMIKTKQPQKFEYEIKINNEKKYFEAKLNILNENEYIALCRDITENKIAEKQIIESKIEAEIANKSKSLFLSKITHDLKNYINAILLMGNMIKAKNKITEINEDIKIIDYSTYQIDNLVNDLLDLAKLENDNLVLVKKEFLLKKEINKYVKWFVSTLNQRNNKIILIIDNNIPEKLIGDKYRLTRIIQNLLTNSNKFTNNGEIKLDIRLEKETKDNYTIKFIISDTGTGIEKDKIDKLFVPYYQAHDFDGNGTGLGLALCKELVELMNGEINIESELDKGTTVIFTAVFDKLRQS